MMAYLDTSIPPSAIAFTKDYHDQSGVQYSVSYGGDLGEGVVCIEANTGHVEFHIDHLDWFIKRLERIKVELIP